MILGPQEALFSGRFCRGDQSHRPGGALRQPMRLAAKLRYTPKTAPCQFTRRRAASGWDEPQRGPDAQAGGCPLRRPVVIGGGTIMGGEPRMKKSFAEPSPPIARRTKGSMPCSRRCRAAAPVPGHNPGAGRSGAYDGLRICHQPTPAGSYCSIITRWTAGPGPAAHADGCPDLFAGGTCGRPGRRRASRLRLCATGRSAWIFFPVAPHEKPGRQVPRHLHLSWRICCRQMTPRTCGSARRKTGRWPGRHRTF